MASLNIKQTLFDSSRQQCPRLTVLLASACSLSNGKMISGQYLVGKQCPLLKQFQLIGAVPTLRRVPQHYSLTVYYYCANVMITSCSGHVERDYIYMVEC